MRLAVIAAVTLLLLGIFVTVFALVLFPRIAVIEIKGPIGDLPGGVEARDVLEKIREAEENPGVVGVLLDIDSPGGTLVASRQIMEAVRDLNKPVVAYIEETGTSGAYLVASGADYIISDPDALTGSIGVIGYFPSIKGLLEKLGINVKIIQAGKYKAAGSPFKEMTPEEEELFSELIWEAYNEFVELVMENRGKKLKDFEKVSDGRVLLGRDALKYGLVDGVGSYEDALEKVKEMAGAPEAIEWKMEEGGNSLLNIGELIWGPKIIS